MAHSVSAQKRVRQNEKHRLRNRAWKSRVRNSIKRVQNAIDAGDADRAADMYREMQKLLDRAVAKGVFHRNTASRAKSRLGERLKKLSPSA